MSVPAATPAATAATAGGPFRWGRVLLTILLFVFVALGKRYSKELGEWFESMFGS